MVETTTVILDIEIKTEDLKAAGDAMEKAKEQSIAYQQTVNALKKEQAELNKQQKALNAQTNVSSADTAALAKKQVELKNQMAAATKGVKDSTKEFNNNKVILNSAKGSNEQLKAQLSLQTVAYNKLSDSQKKNTKSGRLLGKQVKGVTDKLKENEKAVGDSRRNVGNYEESIMKAAGSLNIMGVNVGGVITGLKTQKQALKAQMAAQKASTVATGVGTGALKLFRIALISTGIGALLVAVGALVAYFTQTKRGAELLKQAFAGMKATIAVLVDRLSGLVDAFILFKDGKFAEAGDAIAKSFKGIGAEMVADAKKAALLEKQMQALVDAERDLSVEVSNRKAEVAELQLLAEDETKSFKVRGDAIRKANEIQNKQANDLLKLQRERVRITKEQIGLGESMGEDLSRLSEEQVKLGEIEAANLKKLRSLKAKENSIVNQERAQTTKAAADLRKLTDDQVKAEEKAAADRAAIREDFRREQLTDLESRKEDALERASELREAGAEEVEIEKFLSQELIEIHRAEQDIILNGKLQAFEDFAKAARIAVKLEIDDAEMRKLALLAIDEELLLAKQQTLDLEVGAYLAGTEALGVIDVERQAQLLLDKEEIDAQLVEINRKKIDVLKAQEKELADQKKADQKEAKEAAKDFVLDVLAGIGSIAKAQVAAITARAKAEGKSQEEIEKLTEKARKTAKKAAIAAALIQTFQAAISAYNSGVKVPIIGLVLGPLAAAAALIFGFAQVANIKNQKFSRGGILEGADHGHGGIPISVNGYGGYEGEDKEIILTKGVYQNPRLRGFASELNVAAGGRSLMGGTGGGMLAAGGVLTVSDTFTARSTAGGLSIRDLSEAFDEALRNLPPSEVKVSEINKVSDQVRKVKVTSDLN